MNSVPNQVDELNPMTANMERVPRLLYKYCRLDESGYSLQLALNGEAYFSSASSFNDPFECCFIPTSVITSYEGDELEAYLRKKAIQHFPMAGEGEIQEHIERGKLRQRWLKNGDPRAIEPMLEIQYGKFGICSLSADPNSLPMWGYYADSHKGVCIGLRSSVVAEHQRALFDQDRFMVLKRVRYTKKLPKLHIDTDPTRKMSQEEISELEETLFTKSICWEHEQEYRLIFHNHSARSYTFGKNAVAEVIVGSRVSERVMDTLVDQLRSAVTEATLIQAVRSQSEFAVDFFKIE